MSRRAQRAALAVFVATALCGTGASAGAFLMIYRYPDRPRAGAGREVEVAVPRGATLPKVAALLAARGVIDSPRLFRLYVTWRGLSQRVRAGDYRLRDDATPRRVLDDLVRGARAPELRVTLPEGKNIVEVAAILEDAGAGPRAAFLDLARDTAFARRLGVPGDTLEGFLFPDSYRLRVGDAPEDVLRALFARFREVLAAVKAAHPGGAARLRERLGWGDRELVTLASIVEKETGAERERALVASVYLNRLLDPGFRPRRLEADPTILYGCTVPQRVSAACRALRDRIRTAQLRDPDNPYNTYVHEGLPPGPIANPGRAALQAVLAPADTRYLYFVSRNDGTHEFSETVEAHRRAVDRYQR